MEGTTTGHGGATPPPPMGILVGPFVVGTAMVLALAWLLEIPLGLGTVAVAIGIGVLFALFALVSRLQRLRAAQAVDAGVSSTGASPGTPTPEASASVQDTAEARGTEDPLAHIHRVEDTGRRYAIRCTNCGQEVQGDPDRCPNCAHKLRFNCKRCRTSVKLEWGRCPECGAEF